MDEMTSLVEQAQRGEPKALEKLLSTIAPAIHRFGLRMCRSEHDADDVLQDALLLVATKLGEFEGRSSLPSWAFALTRSACARKRRGLKNQPPVDDAILHHHAGVDPSPEQVVVERELSRALREALDRLPDDYREVILMRDMEGLTAPEVAAALETSVDAVKSRLHRARSVLREQLRPVLESPSLAPAPGCPDVVTMLSRKLEGELTQEDCASIERHLEGCPRCTAVCDAVRSALATCRRSADEPVHPEIQARLEAAVRACLVRRR